MIEGRFLSLPEIKDFPPLEWLIEDMIPAQSLGVLFGPPGIGKSFLALSMAMHVALGKSLGPMLCVKKGNVLYVAAEGLGDLKERLEAQLIWHNLTTEDSVLIYDSPLDLSQENEVTKFIANAKNIIKEKYQKFSKCNSAIHESAVMSLDSVHFIDLIILDTLSQNSGDARENEAGNMASLLRNTKKISREFNAAVLLIHHSIKGNSNSERGSGALRGNVDFSLSFNRERASRNLLLSCLKMKYGEPFEAISFKNEVIDIGEGKSSLVVEYIDRRSPKDALSEDAAVIAKIVSEDFPEGGRHGEILSMFLSVTAKNKSAFNRALKCAVSQGLIVGVGEHKSKSYFPAAPPSQMAVTQPAVGQG